MIKRYRPMIKRYRPLSEHHEGMIYMAEDKDGPWVRYNDYMDLGESCNRVLADSMYWVSVDERLPDKNGLIFTAGRDIEEPSGWSYFLTWFLVEEDDGIEGQYWCYPKPPSEGE